MIEDSHALVPIYESARLILTFSNVLGNQIKSLKNNHLKGVLNEHLKNVQADSLILVDFLIDLQNVYTADDLEFLLSTKLKQ